MFCSRKYGSFSSCHKQLSSEPPACAASPIESRQARSRDSSVARERGYTTAKVGGGRIRRHHLASAGLKRLGKTELVKQIIPAEIMCPAAGQGALGIEIREGDAATRELLVFLNDANARAATSCERALLNSLGGGCQVPIGAFAEVRNGTLHLESIVADPDGSKLLRDSREETIPQNSGTMLGLRFFKVAVAIRFSRLYTGVGWLCFRSLESA